jgi:hypothetical protein
MKECESVVYVFLVQLDDLELGEEQLGQGNGHGVHLQPGAYRYLVAHAEATDEDVDLAPICLIEEQQSILAVEGIEPHLR